MRRIPSAATAALGGGLLLVTAAFPIAAWAAPSPAPVPSAVPGQSVCDVDAALGGITGLAATANGYAVVVKPESGLIERVYLLDASCKRSKNYAYTNPGPNSPQDIQQTSDGSLWVADSGDNLTNPTRKSIALWKFADGKSTLYRFTFPDGPKSAQALLMGPDGNPLFVTDNPNGPAGLYLPDGPLDATGKAVPLKHVGDFTPQQTGTDNTLGKVGQARVSGAATSPDGKKVVLRTYSDAYEWTVATGDLVTTITTTTPRITPLPGEALGEAISYSRDGASYLTVSDVINKQSSTPIQILKYRPAAPPATVPAKVGATGNAITGKGDTRDWLGKLGLQEILNIVIAIGVIGVLMVVLGIVGIRRSRRQPPPTRRPTGRGPSGRGPDGRGLDGRGDGYDDGYDDEPDDPRVAVRARVDDRRRARVPDRYEDPEYDAYESGPAVPPPPPPPPAPPRTYGTPQRYSSGYEPEPEPPVYDPYHPDGYGGPAPRPPAPTGPPPRERGGIARNHRSGRRGSRDDTGSGRRGGGGYADEHEGFGDILGDR